ncbi:MAG: class I SAM-dependent methyltransferase, partial [Parcubacteria group bacterium]
LMEAAETNDMAYQAIRIAVRDAIRTIGAKAYKYEWVDTVTYTNIDTLLEGLASYKKSNQVIAQQLTEKLKKQLATSDKIIILDLGSGVGGTSMELLRHIDELMQSEGGIKGVQNKIRLVLYDVSSKQLEIAKNALQKEFSLNDIVTVEGGFNEVANKLSRYAATIDIVVSGAAICHVINKSQFFSELHDLMAVEGVLSFWDPAFPIYQADYVHLSKKGEHYVEYRTTDGKIYRVKKGELLDVDVIRKLENQHYTTHTTVDADGMALFITALMHMYTGQIGYSSDNIDEQKVQQLKNKLKNDVMKDASGDAGFNLVQWYKNNLATHPVYSALPNSARTPYDLIEAVSDEEAYERILRSSGFISYRACRLMKPQVSGDHNSVQSIFAYFYAEKSSQT